MRRSRKLSKVTINLPTLLVENLDYLANETESDRTDVITEILEAVMENEDLIDLVFGEALPTEDENESEDEEEDETETEASNEAESDE